MPLFLSWQASCVGMMAKGIPSFSIGRRFGISLLNAESFTASRSFAPTTHRWPTNPNSISPEGLCTHRLFHSQSRLQIVESLNSRPSAATFSSFGLSGTSVRNRHPLLRRTDLPTQKIGRLHISSWILQRRCYGTDGKESRCACGKEVKNPRLEEAKNATHAGKTGSQVPKEAVESSKADVSDAESESIAASMSKYLHLPHLPKMPHPTKEELLAAANGFWDRLTVRLKWISIRSTRPWNADEWGAFVSWFMLGHLAWILLGTTTFVSLLIFSINTVFAQGLFIPKRIDLRNWLG